jgi:hypothetical protein
VNAVEAFEREKPSAARVEQIGEVPSQHPPDRKNISGPWAASRRRIASSAAAVA